MPLGSSIPLEDIQWALVEGVWPNDGSYQESDVLSMARDTVQGNLSEVLTSPFAKTLLTADPPSRSSQRLDVMFSSFGTAQPVSMPNPNPEEAELMRLCVGVALLHAFVQLNWTGPDLELSPASLVTTTTTTTTTTNGVGEDESLSDDSLNQLAIAELAFGGEPAYHLARSPVFLRWALLIFSLQYTHCRSAPWWKLRATIIHQYLLDEPAHLPPSFYSELEAFGSYLLHHHQTLPDLQGRFLLEQGLLHHLFTNDRVAADYFVRATRATGLQYELTGALGKRTKFQQTELSQLVLLAESRHRSDNEETNNRESTTSNILPTPVPDTLPLNDDTLLEQTEFTSSQLGQPASTSRLSHLSPSAQPPLHPLDQCLLLSLCLNIKNTSPAHGLTAEQMMPYISRVISHPRNWSVHTMALLLRSRLEASRTRTVERAVLQLQALVDQMPTADSTLQERLRYVHDMPLPSKWHLERELAMRFLTLGVVKSALEIFERLEMWEEVVKCWQAMERPQKGIAIVRDLLEGRKEESEHVVAKGKGGRQRGRQNDAAREAKLWCLLGDLEPGHARTHYERAWAESKETSGRAMRSLGGYYFARNEYEEAVTCLERAVAINPMLSRPWFILGCAQVRLENWMGARDAFVRCVSIDDEDGESWSNLASVYLRMGDGREQDLDPACSQEEPDGHAGTSSPLSGATTNASGAASNRMLAFRALRQGLKYSYENWRMWTNYMVVAVDVGELAEAARAVSRIVEQRAEKEGAACVDEDVLGRLVDAVTRVAFDQKTPDEPGGRWNSPNEGHGLLPRVLDLFERTLLQRVSSRGVWHAYARLMVWQGRWGQALKAHLDAYREGLAGGGGEGVQEMVDSGDVERWREAVGEVEEVVDVLRNLGPRTAAAAAAANDEGSESGLGSGPARWRFQARSIVRSFMGKTKDFENEPEWGRLVSLMEELK